MTATATLPSIGYQAPAAPLSYGVEFFDMIGVHRHTNSQTGEDFLQVSGVTEQNHIASLSINVPQGAPEGWLNTVEARLKGLMEAKTRRIPITDAVWEQDFKDTGEPVLSKGKLCGKLRRSSLAVQVCPRFDQASIPPVAMDLSGLNAIL